jgi:hypothetical protein
MLNESVLSLFLICLYQDYSSAEQSWVGRSLCYLAWPILPQPVLLNLFWCNYSYVIWVGQNNVCSGDTNVQLLDEKYRVVYKFKNDQTI